MNLIAKIENKFLLHNRVTINLKLSIFKTYHNNMQFTIHIYDSKNVILI